MTAYSAMMEVYPFTLNDIDGEIWQWVKHYKGLYEVSNYGRVKSYHNNTEKILKPNLSDSGYLYVQLSKGRVVKNHRLHRLIAQAFLSNPDNLPEVDHVDGDRLNCTVNNLRYVSRRENIRYARERAAVDKPAVQSFVSKKFGEIRIAGTPDNPLFSLADVCRALEIGNPSDVKKRLDDGVVSIEVIFDSLGRKQNAVFVNEDGLYDVILDSRKPEAKQFRKWITSEVLPSIRKTGKYELSPLEAEEIPLRDRIELLMKLLDKTDDSALKDELIRKVMSMV